MKPSNRILRRHRLAQRQDQRAPVVTAPRWRSNFLPVLIAGLVFGAGLLYVAQINQVATGGLTIKALENRVASLKLKNQELELQATAFRSLDTVEATSKSLNLLVQAPVHYLPSVPSSVALSK